MRRALLVLLFLVSGCAMEVIRAPVDFAPINQAKARRIVTIRPVEIMLDSHYSRTISAGVVLIEVGSVSAGQVFKPVNIAFTVEGKHMHEAYFVLRKDRIVGFYLPVEKAFSPLSQSVVLSIRERGQ